MNAKSAHRGTLMNGSMREFWCTWFYPQRMMLSSRQHQLGQDRSVMVSVEPELVSVVARDGVELA